MEAALVFAAANGNARKVARLLSQGGRVDAKEQGQHLILEFQSFIFSEEFVEKKDG